MTSCTRKTRSKRITNLSKYLGGPAELIPSKVPTLRDILRYVLFLQRYEENDGAIFPVAYQAAEAVMQAWSRSNSNFSPPVTVAQRAISSRIERAYNTFAAFTNRKMKKKSCNNNYKSSMNSWTDSLDKLFDITKCRCALTICTFDSNFCKPGCQVSF